MGEVIPLRSRNAVADDLAVLAAWVGSQRECELWAGPRVPFPLQLSALAAQIEMADAINVALDDEHGLAAFGQALPRGPGRAHLARVIVRPGARRRGLGRTLVEALLARVQAAGFTRVTLHVFSDNAAATRLYAGLGFRRAERPPDDAAPSGVWFMQRDVGSASQGRSAEQARASANLRSEWPEPRKETMGGRADERRARWVRGAMTQPSLAGPRTQLEPLLEAELEQLGILFRQPGVQPWWGDPSPEGLRSALLAAPDTLSWSIRVGGELAGATSSFDAGWPPGSSIGLMIALGDAWQDRGLGPEALSLLIAHHIANGVHRFSVDPVTGNARAIHAYESCGFRPVGVLRRYEPAPEGGWRDCLLMDLLADEFVDRREG